MKKTWIIILILAIITLGIMIGIIIYQKNTNKIVKQNVVENKSNEISEVVTDECTEEWEEMEQQTKLEIEANSNEGKISPNCRITLKKHYKSCGHTLNEYTYIPQNLVNKTQIELKEEYSEWEVGKYSSTEITLYREYDGKCGEHFILKDNNGKIAIYKIDENNKELLYEQTEIAIDYLTEKDKMEIKNGISVNGKENLNQLIEDFE